MSYQAQIREDSLQAENAAYAKAIAAGQQQIQEKSQEKYQLEARLKAQAEALANERNALEFRLEEVDEARRQLHLGNVDTNFKRNKTGRSGLSASSSANATYDESKMHSQILSTAVRPRAVKGAGESTSKITGAADLFSLRTGGQRRFMLLRSLIVLYILGLHLVVFIIISFSKLGR